MTFALAQSLAALVSWPELSVLLKATLALGLGLGAVRLLSRTRAAALHLLAAATFAALVAIPLVESAGPAITVEIPAALAQSVPRSTDRMAAGSLAAVVAAAESGRPASAAHSWSAAGILRGLWLAGAAFVMAALALSLWRLRRIRLEGIPSLELGPLTRELAEQRGVRAPVEVLIHEGIAAPLTCGFSRPAIILPANVAQWRRDEVLRALVHEIEHVRRADWAVQIFARAVCALYWFHPLVWAAWRALRVNAERACDDAVLQGSDAADYAEQLVSLARRQSGPQAAALLGMATRSDLSARVAALLSGTQRRGPLDRRTAVCALALSALAVTAIAPVRAVAQRARVEAEESAPESPFAEEIYEAASRGRIAEIEGLLARGASVNAVLHGDGSPLIGAAREGRLDTVVFLLDRGADPDLGVQGDGSPLIAAAQEGRADIVQLLLDRGADPNVGVRSDGNPLIMAARAGQLGIVETLLNRGARIEEIVPGDENALISASAAGRLEVVQFLVSRGADVNAGAWSESGFGGQQGEWRTPLNMARRGGHQGVVDYLRSAGARE